MVIGNERESMISNVGVVVAVVVVVVVSTSSEGNSHEPSLSGWM